MYAEASPFIQPDMSNHYRLLRERFRRERVLQAYPDYQAQLERISQHAAIQSFLQAIPRQGINPNEDVPGVVTPGVRGRGIEITNSITERKIFLRRLMERILDPRYDGSDAGVVESHAHEYMNELGLDRALADRAMEVVERQASQLKTGRVLRVVPGNTP